EPGGGAFAVSMVGGGVTIWELPDGRLRTKVGPPESGVLLEPRKAAFSHDRKLFATSALMGVALWQAGDGALRGVRPLAGGAVQGFAFSPDGKTVAIRYVGGEFEPRLTYWDIPTVLEQNPVVE